MEVPGTLHRLHRRAAATPQWTLAAAMAVAVAARLALAPLVPLWDGARYNDHAAALLAGRVESWNHIGFQLLVAPLVPLFGHRAATAVSLAAGVLSVAAVHALARRLHGPRAAWVAALAVALAPVHVYWSGVGHAGTTALLALLAALLLLYGGRPWAAAAAWAAGVAVRPDYALLLPAFALLPRVDPRLEGRWARPFLLLVPVAALAGAFYAVRYGARLDNFAWWVPPEVMPTDWWVRANIRPDGTLGLGPALVGFSPGYAPANLLFYGDVLLDWNVAHWGGWPLYAVGNPLIALLAAYGLWRGGDRGLRWMTLLVAAPLLAFYAVYYGFSPEYVMPLLAPMALAAGLAVERAWPPGGAPS